MSLNNDDSPLISAIELKEILGEKNTKIFDIRGKWGDPPTSSFDDYAEGHIPYAVYLDWTTQFLEPNIALNLASVASKAQAQETFKRLGISSDDTVILYDDYHHMLAGRIWWAMRYWGFSNVKVLNGGWEHWSTENFPISTNTHDREIGQTIEKTDNETFIVNEQLHLKVNLEEVKNRSDNECLIDARGPIGYQGDPSDLTSGHIPGAINLPYSSLLDKQSILFKDAKALEVLFGDELKDLDTTKLISSCGSGYAGTVLLIALKIVGIDAPLFDGSFSAWKENGTLPIEQG